MTLNNRILPASTSQALSVLRDARYGEHIFVIYEDITSLRELYSLYASENLKMGKDSLLILPYLETVDSVKTHLMERGISIRENQLEGALTVIDACQWFFGTNMDANELTAKMFSDLNTSNRDGASVIVDLGVFFLKGEEAKLIGLESALSSKINAFSKIICCMNRLDFDRLVQAHKDILLSSHHKSLGITSTQNIIFEEALAQSVSEAMSIYGKQVSQTLSAYLEREHSIPPDTLADNPHALVDALEKILDSGSRIVERKILRSLYSKIGVPAPQSSSSDFEGKISEVKKIYQKYYQ